MPLKQLPEDDRPREKFLLKGKAVLSDSELLAIILGSGNQNETAIELSRKILTSVENSWHRLSLLSVKDLMKFKGIGEAKAIAIASALEIARRKASEDVPVKKNITTALEAHKIFLPYLSDLKTEEFWAAFLNTKNQVLGISQIAKGGVSKAFVDLKVLFKTAIDHMASAIIVAHNHPTGEVVPSQQDISLTHEMAQAAQLLEIQLLDHLILGANRFFSFKEENLL